MEDHMASTSHPLISKVLYFLAFFSIVSGIIIMNEFDGGIIWLVAGFFCG